jgi:hypothetical protein
MFCLQCARFAFAADRVPEFAKLLPAPAGAQSAAAAAESKSGAPATLARISVLIC